MGNKAALITKAEAIRLFKAARASGYKRARLIRHPDGRVELIAEEADDALPPNDWDDVLQ